MRELAIPPQEPVSAPLVLEALVVRRRAAETSRVQSFLFSLVTDVEGTVEDHAITLRGNVSVFHLTLAWSVRGLTAQIMQSTKQGRNVQDTANVTNSLGNVDVTTCG